jgi:hypothetical protein
VGKKKNLMQITLSNRLTISNVPEYLATDNLNWQTSANLKFLEKKG